MPLSPPPAPTWHGFAPDLVKRYAAFALRHQMEATSIRPAQLRQDIADLTERIRIHSDVLTTERTFLIRNRATFNRHKAIFCFNKNYYRAVRKNTNGVI